MIVKSLNKVTLNRIIKHSELEEILNAEVFINNQHELAKELIASAESKALELKEQYRKELQTQNLELLNETEHNLKKILDDVELQIHNVIIKVLDKIGVTTKDIHHELDKIIMSELAMIANIGILKIKANPQTVSLLKNLESSLIAEQIIFLEDNSIEPNTCICETNKWVMNLTLEDAKNKILEFLNVP